MGRVALDHVIEAVRRHRRGRRPRASTVADEEFLVLLGPSGCGKSTALRMIAGLEDPTAGTITIGDRVVNDVEAKDRDIAMVFQSYALYPHMTVRRNIEFPLRSRKVAAVGARPARRRRGRQPRPRRAARAEARAALGWPAAAGRARPRDRAAARRRSSWTSRSRTSTPSSACRRAPSWSSCSGDCRRRSSTSPTIRSRR